MDMSPSTNLRPREGGDIEEGIFHGHVGEVGRKISPIEAPNQDIIDGGHTNLSVVDIEKWATNSETMLADVPKYMCNPGHPGRISRIPENLREVDMKSYEPCYLSIGPYHHGKASLQSMEKTKWVVLKCVLEHNSEVTLKEILMEIRSIEPAARSFYTDVEMDIKKFVQMLLLDSLYLLVIFCGMPRTRQTNSVYSDIDKEDNNDGLNLRSEGIGSGYVSEARQMMESVVLYNRGTSVENTMIGQAWFWTLLVHDIFLLENQIPFFLLQKMHHIVYGGSEAQLLVTLKTMFQDLLSEYVKLDSEMLISPTEEIHHLLHLCHIFFRPTVQQDLTTSQQAESNQIFRLGSALQLYEAGVRFEAKSSSTNQSLLDIRISSSRKMVMPCLHVDDNTNSLLRNLIALEQMKYPSLGLNVSAYAVLLLHLVTKPEDVKFLRRKGIIHHHLASDKEMMYFINRLSVGLAFDYVEDEYCLKPVFQELKRLSNNRVPRWRALFKHKYFNNPWTAMSLLAASLLLLLCAVQTYYTVYSYYRPYFDGHL